MRKINRIILHCSASPDTMNIGALEINDWHLTRGFYSIGYHWVIRRDGTIEQGRPEEKTGAHVKGHNSDSIGIVWVGTDKIEDKQMDALKTKVKELCYRFKLNKENVFGHYELYSGKTCPNIVMEDFRESLVIPSKPSNDQLPAGPSEDDISVSLEEIERQILDGDI